MWNKGEWEILWNRVEQRSSLFISKKDKNSLDSLDKKNFTPNIVFEKVKTLISEGNFSKAMDCLVSSGLADFTDETLSKLKGKHPEGNPVEVEEKLPGDQCYEFSTRIVYETVMDF